VYEWKPMDVRGMTVVNGFPGAGLVSTITANYLIGALKLEQWGAIDSDDFPPVSMIYDKKPKFPARIYAHEKNRVAVILSEFTPPPHLVRPISDMMLNWAKEHECGCIISPEVIHVKAEKEELEVFGVGSTDNAREELKKRGIRQFSQGMISGISGILLNEGRMRDFDVFAMVAQARPGIPDARATAKVIETIIKLVPSIEVDVAPLYEEAERVEGFVRHLREQAKPATEPTTPHNMYM
ncbi:MAG: PAC2 family protein, partial [Candidatus Hydrothermarchaeaceae archaeon]